MVAMNVWPTDAADGSVSSEARWRKMGRLWAPSGVAAGVGSQMLPSLVYPNLTVKAGAAWVDGHYCELPGDQVLAVTPNGLAVVRLDPAANTAQLLYLDGVTVPAQSPTGIYELPIAKITGSALADQRAFTGGQQQWNMPWGVISRNTKQTDTTGIGTTNTDVLALAVPHVAGRVYRLTVYCLVAPGTQGGSLYLKDGAGLPVHQANFPGNSLGAAQGVTIIAVVTPPAGSQTYKLQGGAAGAPTISVLGSANYPVWMIAEDIGPNVVAP